MQARVVCQHLAPHPCPPLFATARARACQRDPNFGCVAHIQTHCQPPLWAVRSWPPSHTHKHTYVCLMPGGCKGFSAFFSHLATRAPPNRGVCS